MKSLQFGLIIRARGDEPEITITTPTLDLMDDTIDPLGMDVSRYLNGTRAVNFAHDHSRLPVGKTLDLAKSPQGIQARFRWLEANPEVRSVRGVFEEGVLGASVELVVPPEGEASRNRNGGRHYAKSILTGWALTSNPANPECVRITRSLGWLAPAMAPGGLTPERRAQLRAALAPDLQAAIAGAFADLVGVEVQRTFNRFIGRVE